MTALGTKSVLNGKPVRWAGENYGWQSFGSYEKLKEQGKFRVGTQVIDRVVNAVNNRLEGASQQRRGVAPEKQNESVRPIGSRRSSDGKLWAGQSYGYQSPESYKQLQQSGHFRGGQILVGRIGNDITQAIDPRIRSAATNAITTGSRIAKDLYDKAPAPVQAGVRLTGGGLKNIDNTLEAISRTTNIGRGISDEIVITGATFGAGKVFNPAKNALKAADSVAPVTRQAAGLGIQRGIQRQIQAGRGVPAREVGAINPAGRKKANPQPIPARAAKIGTPKAVPARLRAPRDERILTLDKNPEELFKAWQQAGKIPPEYTSWQDLESRFKALVEGGLSEEKARKKMGVVYRNVEGKHILQKNYSSKGELRYLNKRSIRTDVNVGTENHLRRRGGQSLVDAYRAKAGENWNAATEERIRRFGGRRLVNAYREKVRKDWEKLSKLEAQQMGVETGKQFHRGHVQSGLFGGSLAIENMWPEHGLRNMRHGANPRILIETMRELGIPLNETETFYERLLQEEGLFAAPRPSNALMIAADEYMVQPKKGNTYAKPGDYDHDPLAGINPDRLAALQDRMDQLEAQGVSRQALENYARNLSGTLSTGDSVKQSGPLRVIRKADPTVEPSYKTPPSFAAGTKKAKRTKAARAPKAIPNP